MAVSRLVDISDKISDCCMVDCRLYNFIILLKYRNNKPISTVF